MHDLGEDEQVVQILIDDRILQVKILVEIFTGTSPRVTSPRNTALQAGDLLHKDIIHDW